jgi:hypothetical protein
MGVAETGVQIDWRAASASDVVTSVRRSLQANNRTPAPAAIKTAQARPAADGSRLAVARAVKLKRLHAVGGAAGKPSLYAFATAVLVAVGVAGVWKANVSYAPEMYDGRGLAPIAEAFAAGQNYAVFDLNLNIRKLREEQVGRFSETPDVVVLGASHWQEAHSDLVRTKRMYNGHVHRDYWEDMLGQVEIYVRNNRLPKQMIIGIRDNLFTPVALRKDYLWEPGIPYYRAMAERLGIAKESFWTTFPIQRVKERLSLSMLFNNVTRWFNAKERPHTTSELHSDGLDTLLPDGSILWSSGHMAVFTPDRAKKEALDFAERRRNDPPKIDPAGVQAIHKLLGFLKENGTEVTLVHPPFNPLFYDHVKGGTYLAGLEKVRQITRELAAAHGLRIIGEFDPAKVGCTAGMYIDAEHSNPTCLQHIFKAFETPDAPLPRQTLVERH